MNARKVLILTARDPVFEVRVFHLSAKALVQAGYDVTIVAPRTSDVGETGEVDGIHYFTYRKWKGPLLRKLSTVWNLLVNALTRPADIFEVFEVDAPLFVAALAKRLLRLRGQKRQLVFDSTEVWPYFYSSKTNISFFRPLRIWTTFIYEWWLMNHDIDGVVAAHHLEENYYVWLNSWVPVRTALSGPDIDAWGKPRSRSGTVKIIGYDGYFSLTRGMDLMLGAFERIAEDYPGIQFLASGDFLHDEDRRWFESWCEHTGLQDRVEWTGWVERDKQVANLDRMDIGMATNHEDDHSIRVWPANKIMNYLGRGIPYVSTLRTPAHRLRVEETGGGVVSHDSTPEAIAETLRDLIDHPEKIVSLGGAGYQYAKKHLSIQQGRRNVQELFADLERFTVRRNTTPSMRGAHR